ncbi:MAG: hypothetical protein V2A62_04155 [Candidatus Woesearchaeota archaeon]
MRKTLCTLMAIAALTVGCGPKEAPQPPQLPKEGFDSVEIVRISDVDYRVNFNAEDAMTHFFAFAGACYFPPGKEESCAYTTDRVPISSDTEFRIKQYIRAGRDLSYFLKLDEFRAQKQEGGK